MSIISYTRYSVEGSAESWLATVFPPVKRQRRSTLRDRIARLHLDAVDPRLRSSFDRMGAKVYARASAGPDTVTVEIKL